MKISYSPASTLLFLPFLSSSIPAVANAQPLFDLRTPSSSFVGRMEIADIYKKTLLNAPCTKIRLTDRYVLRATCESIMGPAVDTALDLNGCFANYLGSLARVRDGKGGFGGSCDSCELQGTKLACECRIGAEANGGMRHSEVELDDWDVVQVNLDTGLLQCMDTFGLEKR
ncbi:hypothetical protein F5X99DRAFT_428336 [Biscogniauxia marginata]|nr:hypothetical protein F5X99DRAFT_428336 [Biscogniauxia marginata]